MSRRARETALVTALALLVTMAIAAPVIEAPSRRIFGAALVGHHHDPFTFMQQIAGRLARGVYLQPATDVPAAVIARATGAVAAYNWIVLLTFPLSAATAFLLARHLGIASAWSAAAAMLFAFSPFHLAHAAYHPHIAQTQWIPLYLLVLWRAVDAPARGSVIALVLVTAGAVMSNFYGGLILMVITPAALAAYWLWRAQDRPNATSRVAITAGVLALMAATGAAYAVYAIGGSSAPYASYGTAPEDLVRYGTRWWSYAMPPAAHPLAGASVQQQWRDAGVDVGLLEQQVSLGWGLMALAVVAIAARLPAPSKAAVRVLVAIGGVAFVFSLASGPAALLRELLPMFRAYARFGVVVQLMVALLAAIGAEHLWSLRSRGARIACVALIALGIAEYAVWPPSMSRAVLPTRAHQWAADQTGCVRVLDCAPAGGDAASIQWLTHYRVSGSGGAFPSCTGPGLADRLAAAGFTHVIVRRDTAEARGIAARSREGFPPAAYFADSNVYAVAARAAAIPSCGMQP